MTFEQFQQSRVWSANLNKDLNLELDERRCGYSYEGLFYIFAGLDHEDAYALHVERSEYQSNSLEKLERILWDTFAQTEMGNA